jgi:hypothetical protein
MTILMEAGQSSGPGVLEIVSLIASVVSVILAIFAIWLSLTLYKWSRDMRSRIFPPAEKQTRSRAPKKPRTAAQSLDAEDEAEDLADAATTDAAAAVKESAASPTPGEEDNRNG